MTKKCKCVADYPPHGNQYAERDIQKQCEVYALHVSHMTSEKLHDKSAIAAELAHRDICIRELEAENRIKSEFLLSRQCPDHSGKWERGRCLQCEIEEHKAKHTALLEKLVEDVLIPLGDMHDDMHEYGGQAWSPTLSNLMDRFSAIIEQEKGGE